MLYIKLLFSCTVLKVEFAQTSYLGGEKSGFLSVMLLLKEGSSADDITVTVMPSDQSPVVSARGIFDVNDKRNYYAMSI